MNARGWGVAGLSLLAVAGMVAVGVVATAGTKPPALALGAPSRASLQASPSGDDARIGQLERRILELEARSPSAPSPPVSATPPTPPSPPPPSPEESRVHFQAQHTQNLEKHRAEGVDPAWARGAQNRLTEDLGSVAKAGHFSLGAVDCKTTTCVAAVTWPSYAEARATYKTILHSNLSMGCSREVYVPPATDPSAVYETSVYFDCESDRVK